ncbi:hypothetical protein RI570_20115 [Brucella pseudogrignonensis]|uniref:hypothetical protein n=1 Tax=Brucella pseudogrignonensis TaxID=419475 RepID=UPI0028B95113|nr:hypothetical protein [Brucella pseudogrignonensis]MDT6942374.1 hypothetical protein [Brucella pseudogrignonensis]
MEIRWGYPDHDVEHDEQVKGYEIEDGRLWRSARTNIILPGSDMTLKMMQSIPSQIDEDYSNKS